MVVRRIAADSETEYVVALIKAGEYRKAFDQSVAQLGTEVGQYCMAMLGDQALAEEASIDALADFYAAMPTLTNPRPRPWLFGAARRACQRLRPAAPPSTPPPQPYQASLDEAQDPAARALQMRALLATVHRDERDTALLRYLARLDYADIAALCESEEDSVRKQVSKSLLRLRTTIAESQNAAVGDSHGERD